jgi:hypothetical protein
MVAITVNALPVFSIRMAFVRAMMIQALAVCYVFRLTKALGVTIFLALETTPNLASGVDWESTVVSDRGFPEKENVLSVLHCPKEELNTPFRCVRLCEHHLCRMKQTSQKLVSMLKFFFHSFSVRKIHKQGYYQEEIFSLEAESKRVESLDCCLVCRLLSQQNHFQE